MKFIIRYQKYIHSGNLPTLINDINGCYNSSFSLPFLC